MKALFVVNRRSGVKRWRDINSIIREACLWDHEIAECDQRDDLDALVARAAREDFDVIYAVGGDGTAHEVARRLIGTPLALGIVPTGSGNGFARHIGLPLNLRRSLRACSNQRIVTIDTASVNGIPFIATMGVGFDASIAGAFATHEARGFRTYVRTGIRGWRRYAPQEYSIDVDGEHLQRRALLVAVANASQYGNNARIAPLASLQDGALNVVIVERASIAAVARLFTGTLDRARGVTMRRGRHIDIQRQSPGPAHLDGEPVALPESLTIDVVPQSLRILLPDATRAI